MVGPLAILPLLSFISLDAAFWFCSVFYFIGSCRSPASAPAPTGRIDASRSFWSNFIAGFEYIYTRPHLLAVVLLAVAHCSLTMSYEAILPAISVDKLGAGSVGVSYLMGGVGVGALVSSVFLAGIRGPAVRGKIFSYSHC